MPVCSLAELFLASVALLAMRIISIPPPPLGWDPSPPWVYSGPQYYTLQYPFIHLGEERHCESTGSCAGLESGLLNQEYSALTIKPPHLQNQ